MIIACGYKKRVGKDEFYKKALELYPLRNIHRVAFADALKEEVYDLILKPNNLARNVLDDPETKELYRPFLEWYSTEFRRNPACNGRENYWVEQGMKKIDQILEKDPGAIVIITDCRFPNEFEEVKKRKGISLHISRNNIPGPTTVHTSQMLMDDHLDMFDCTLDNNGTIEEYHEKIKIFLSDVIWPLKKTSLSIY